MTKSNELLKKNVLECSLNKTNFEEACTEWRFIDKKSYDKCDKCGHRYNNNWNTNCDECKHWHCTCSKALKHISYYINTNTKKIISVGNSCEKNFKEQLKNNIVSINNLFKVFLNITGIYIGDFDLKKFCQYNKFKVYRILKKDIDNINSIDKLLEYKEYLLEDIWTDAYDVTKLVHDIDDKITQITEELAAKKAAEELAAKKAAEELAAKKAAEELAAKNINMSSVNRDHGLARSHKCCDALKVCNCRSGIYICVICDKEHNDGTYYCSPSLLDVGINLSNK
jgi:hypothetical protein